MFAAARLGSIWSCFGSIVAVVLAAGCTPSANSDRIPPAERGEPSPGSAAEAPSDEPRRGRRDRKPFDPIRDNGPIFTGWPAPELAIVITGRQNGYLEPCGCAGLDRMRGGLSRRQAMVESLRQKGWPLVLVDVGGLSQRFGPQAILKFRTSVEAMTAMGYEAIGLGTAELRLPVAELVTLVAEEGRPGRFVSANVGLFGLASQITPKKRIIEVAGVKLGVTSVLGKKEQRQINNPDVEMTDPEAALARLVPELRPACDLMILLAHADKEESVALARRFPAFDVVVSAGGGPVPPAEPERIEGSNTLLIEVGEKVKDAVVLGRFDDPQQPLRYQRVPLDSRFAPSARIKALMADYQDALRQLGLEGLGVRPVPHRRKPLQGDFAGTEKCAACHETPHDAWKKSGHAKATRTLVALAPPRQFDPECLACHTTGWHPQGIFPYQSGYLGPDRTPQLAAVGCESCHGPGGAHAAAEAGGDKALQHKLQQAMALTEARAKREICAGCHDVNNSPDFEFEAYWPDVAHPEDD